MSLHIFLNNLKLLNKVFLKKNLNLSCLILNVFLVVLTLFRNLKYCKKIQVYLNEIIFTCTTFEVHY